ncbi:MAG: hypothetical protein ACTSWY_07765 [Promethearchaeota archaeon]
MEELCYIEEFLEQKTTLIDGQVELEDEKAKVFSFPNGKKIYIITCDPSIKKKGRIKKKTFLINKTKLTVDLIAKSNYVGFNCLSMSKNLYFYVILPSGFLLKMFKTISRIGKKRLERAIITFIQQEKQFSVFKDEERKVHMNNEYYIIATALKPELTKFRLPIVSQKYDIIDFINNYNLISKYLT